MSTVVSDCFTIGSIVATRTCYDEDIEGEVLAFDPQTKMLILKCPSSSGDPKRHDVNIVNLSLVSDVQIKKEVTAVPEPPATLNLNRLNTRVRNSIENKRRLVSTLYTLYNKFVTRLSVHKITKYQRVNSRDILLALHDKFRTYPVWRCWNTNIFLSQLTSPACGPSGDQ